MLKGRDRQKILKPPACFSFRVGAAISAAPPTDPDVPNLGIRFVRHNCAVLQALDVMDYLGLWEGEQLLQL